MAISIKQPAALCEKGMREINEDYIYPQFGQIDETQRFFMVCDGMGGEGKGDVAAKMVANHMANFLSSLSWGSSPTDEQLKQGLASAEEALSAYMQMNPSAIGMGTTLSLVYLGDNEVTLAWVGNSPIFYFRKRNFSLTRAEEISASGPYTTSPPTYHSEIPPIIYGKESPAELNVRRIPITEIQEGDYFFISSDGIMEQVNQSILATILHSGQSPEFLVTEIQNLSKGLTQDDFSCILIQVDHLKSGSGFTAPKPEKEPATVKSETNSAAVISESAPIAEETSPEVVEDLPVPEAEGEVAPNPFATKAFYLVLGACALLALIGVTLEGLGIGRVSPQKSFENYVESGQNLMDSGEFDAARQVLDTAITLAPDKATEIRITEMRNTAERRFQQFDQMSKMDLPQLKDIGDNLFKQSQWSEAIQYYERAREVAQLQGLEIPEDTRENLIQAYFNWASLYDEGENNNPARALELYQKGLAMEPTEDLERDIAWKNAQNRVAILSKEVDALPEPDGQLADNSNPQTDPFEDPNPSTTERPSLPSNPNPSISIPDDNSNSKVSRSDLGGSSEQRKSLADGKALFEKAKLSNSRSQYQSSIQHLEDAGGSLDGIGAYLLSVMYHEGRAGNKNENKALNYAKTSALKGYSQGHFYYAHLLLLREKRGDTLTAIQSLRIAAEKDHLESINRLNKMGLY